MSTAQDLLDAIPDGGSIDFAGFSAQAGSVANFLKFANPQKLSRNGQHVTIDCTGSGSLSAGGATITTAAVIQFDVGVSGTDATLTNIVGISGHQGIFGGPVTTAALAVISADRFRISGTVHVGFPVGDVNFSEDVDSNGNVLP